MAEFTDTARREQILAPTDVAATPSPVLKFYDAARNKQWGVATLEDVQAKYLGKQEGLAARIRQDKDGRHRRTWDDLVARASEGVRMKVLKQSLEGTKQSTETMVRLTGYSAVTTQQRILLADFLVWAAPELRRRWEQSQIENETGTGVRDFVMPSDPNIIEMGRAAAKKAGCWGAAQILMIGDAGPIVGVADLPKNIDWKPGRTSPYPWWEKKGALVRPWDSYVLYAEVREPGQEPDLQPAWSIDLFAGDKDGATVTFRGRGFVARSVDDTLASAADALDQFKPHVRFLAAQKAELAGWPFVAGDKTGKQHPTLDDIAAKLSIPPGALAEQLRGRGYLNLGGEVTPAALDAGITTIVDDGTRFCYDGIKRLLDKPKAEGTETGEGEAPTPEIDPADETANFPPVTETEEATNATDRAPQVTVRRGGGMRRVTAQQKHQSVADAGEMDKPRTEPLGAETSTRSIDAAALGTQAVKQLEGAVETLLSTEAAVGRRTDEGEFMAHAGVTKRSRTGSRRQRWQWLRPVRR